MWNFKFGTQPVRKGSEQLQTHIIKVKTIYIEKLIILGADGIIIVYDTTS